MPIIEAKLPSAYRLYRWLWTSLDWLYPPRCGGCDAPADRWCLECQRNAKIITPPTCDRCGKPGLAGTCHFCRQAPPHFTLVKSWAIFEGPVRNAIHRLKYKRDVALGEALARMLIQTLVNLAWEIDLVIPVPLGKSRLAERGYNQAALLARPLALAMRLPYQPPALHRMRETRTQVGLSIIERRLNVDGAFQADTALAEGRSVLIVDDVMTTGATLNACAGALLDAGAKHVLSLTLARVS